MFIERSSINLNSNGFYTTYNRVKSILIDLTRLVAYHKTPMKHARTLQFSSSDAALTIDRYTIFLANSAFVLPRISSYSFKFHTASTMRRLRIHQGRFAFNNSNQLSAARQLSLTVQPEVVPCLPPWRKSVAVLPGRTRFLGKSNSSDYFCASTLRGPRRRKWRSRVHVSAY